MGKFCQIVLQQSSVLIVSVGILLMTFGLTTIMATSQTTVGIYLMTSGALFFMIGIFIFLTFLEKLRRITVEMTSLV